jgi:two-component system nitrogen regulation response regulator GlnG
MWLSGVLAVKEKIPVRAFSKAVVEKDNTDNTVCPSSSGSLTDVMGGSKRINDLATEVERVAATDFSVLIVGETGSGKEIAARWLHEKSARSLKPFIAVDCGAIPENLIESELFGHEKGAFTGAHRMKHGKFEAAFRGTLFLDEISNLPLGMQSKLLRVLEEKQFYRVGGMTPINTDVRILASTNRELISPSNSASFRSDLYYRLTEYTVFVPALRERKEDIVFLAERFMGLTNRKLGKHVKAFSEPVLDALVGHDWPGNVRELRNVVRRAVLLAEEVVEMRHLNGLVSGHIVVPAAWFAESAGSGEFSLKEIVHRHTAAVERAVITNVLKKTDGNKAAAARILQIDYKTMHTKVKRYGLSIKGNGDGRKGT